VGEEEAVGRLARLQALNAIRLKSCIFCG